MFYVLIFSSSLEQVFRSREYSTISITCQGVQINRFSIFSLMSFACQDDERIYKQFHWQYFLTLWKCFLTSTNCCNTYGGQVINEVNTFKHRGWKMLPSTNLILLISIHRDVYIHVHYVSFFFGSYVHNVSNTLD